MKLHEFTIPMDAGGGPFDDVETADAADAVSDLRDTAIPQNKHPNVRPRRNSNIAKAKRIKNLVQMMKRERNQIKNNDTPHQYNLGGHTSSFLNR